MTTRPSTGTEDLQSEEELAELVAKLAKEGGHRVAVAESLTAGRVSSMLGRGEQASQWYRGAVVAYDEDVKFRVLGVTPGPVVTDLCAREMAEGVRRLLRADVALGITGVGGPGPDEDCPAGTVHLAVATAAATRSLHACLPGDPSEVVAEATRLCLGELVRELVDGDDA
ncbi:CinA family protein [Microbacterium sp. ARD31]|uniref:CinA family protein n=1 Tax=Microbacterium sp. ARD31 TaxID=2962576 RepID=UPI002880D7D9|nr:CinA family protein [Microbacterium sp. ARD31]MDT0182807.1 CinA family protein [Microbacterium sp. ARD31]